MGVSDDLFFLIRSLTKSEKRLFKLTASKYGEKDNNALQLFNAIDQQEEYNESKLKKKFAGKSIGDNFASEKKNLQSLILKTLSHHSTTGRMSARLDDMMREFWFLFDKGLFNQCRKIIQRIKTLAEKNEQFYTLFQVFEAEAQLLMVMSDIDGLNRMMEEEAPLITAKFDAAKVQMRYLTNHYRTFLISRTLGEDTRNPAVLQSLEKIHSQDLYRDVSEATSVVSQHYFHFMQGLYYRFRSDWKKNYLHSKADVAIYEDHDEFRNENLSSYISALSNLSLAQLELMEYDESIATLQKLRSLDLVEPALRLKADSIYYPRLAGIYHSSGQFDRIAEIVDDLDNFVRTKEGMFSVWRLGTFYHNTGYCYFGIGKYREALRWANRLQNEKKLEQIRPDLFSCGKLFYLFIHLELGNDDLLEHLIRSTERELNKKGMLYEIEKTVLQFFSRIINASGSKEKMIEYKKFAKELDELNAKDPINQFPEYFDYPSWAESKITGRSFQEVVLTNVKKEKVALMKKLEMSEGAL